MADDAVKKAVGYGFDASLRKGTQSGLAAMRGSNEYQRLDAKGKDAAENMFKSRIDTDSNLKQFRGIGDEKVSVYRKAAKEVPSRAIDYKKEFGPKVKKAAPSTKSTSVAKPVKSTTTKPSSKYVKRDIGGGMYTYDEVKIAPPIAAPKPQPNSGAKPAAKAASSPSNQRAVSTGMSQMLNLSSLAPKPAPKATPAPKPAAKTTPTQAKSSPKSTTSAPIRKAMGMPASPKSDKVYVPGFGMRDKDTAMRMRAFQR